MEPLELLKKYVRDEKLIKHCIATAAVMKSLARELGEDEENGGQSAFSTTSTTSRLRGIWRSTVWLGLRFC